MVDDFVESVNMLCSITNKKHILFMDKCRDAAELIMHHAKNLGFNNLVLQEEGGWYTYEKSAKRVGLDVFFAPMIDGVLIKEKFPFKNNSLIIINTNPGYAFVEPLNFYDDIKKNNSLVVNDVVSSIGDEVSLKGDIIIGSFGKHKPLSISSGGAFIACDDSVLFKDLFVLKNSFFKDSGNSVDFSQLVFALNNFKSKKNGWINISNKIKTSLLEQGFSVLNPGSSINVFVKTSVEERENLIKFCSEHNLEYLICPQYIRTMNDAVSIEIKKKLLEE